MGTATHTATAATAMAIPTGTATRMGMVATATHTGMATGATGTLTGIPATGTRVMGTAIRMDIPVTATPGMGIRMAIPTATRMGTTTSTAARRVPTTPSSVAIASCRGQSASTHGEATVGASCFGTRVEP